MKATTISAAEFAQRYKKGMKLVDVRSPAEYGGEHVDGANNEPLDQLDPQQFCQAYVDGDQDDIYLICQKGGRAAKAADAIGQHTKANLFVVDGGTPASIAAGAPAASAGKAVLPLERQVRIAAGSLVLLGCAMGMLLAKMPWNQKS